MSNLKKIKTALVQHPLLAIFCTWWLIMAAAYLLISLQDALQKERSRKSGIEMMQLLSKRISLPLLEKDMGQIRSALADAAQRPGVALAWALDHQDQVLALAAGEKILPPPPASDIRTGEVEVRDANPVLAAPHLNLISPVTFAGTRIGKVSATVAPDAGSDHEALFSRVIVLSGLFFLVLAGALYGHRLTSFSASFRKSRRPIDPGTSGPLRSTVSCPLCGQTHPLSRDLFGASSLDDLPAVSTSGVEQTTGPETKGEIIRWHEVGAREDLAWFRRRAILRCAEIIRVLSN
ncbi:MAG: hypothetical protein R6V84_03300 [Desulfobacterales bacterium]